MTGTLLLAATPIGNVGDASARLRAALAQADVIAAEDSRRAYRLLDQLEIKAKGDVVSFYDAVEEAKSQWVLDQVAAGKSVVVISDAGMPAVSDPGYRLVQAAIARDIAFSVIPGPSAVLTALALSGLPVDRFTFDGFLPRKSGARRAFFEELLHEPRTMVFFEAPHRLVETLDDALAVFGPNRRAAICRELTKTYEETVRGTLADLKAWSAREILGEITLVLAGANPIDNSDPQLWLDEVAVRVAAGVSQRDAIADVARELGVPKRSVYDAVLAAKK